MGQAGDTDMDFSLLSGLDLMLDPSCLCREFCMDYLVLIFLEWGKGLDAGVSSTF